MLSYLQRIGCQQSADYEQELLRYTEAKLWPLGRVRIIGNAPEKEPQAGLTSTRVLRYARELSAQPLMKFLGLECVLRMSLSYFNTREEIDQFTDALQE